MAINYHIRQAIVSKRDETIDVTYQYSIQAFYCIVVQIMVCYHIPILALIGTSTSTCSNEYSTQ